MLIIFAVDVPWPRRAISPQTSGRDRVLERRTCLPAPSALQRAASPAVAGIAVAAAHKSPVAAHSPHQAVDAAPTRSEVVAAHSLRRGAVAAGNQLFGVAACRHSAEAGAYIRRRVGVAAHSQPANTSAHTHSAVVRQGVVERMHQSAVVQTVRTIPASGTLPRAAVAAGRRMDCTAGRSSPS